MVHLASTVPSASFSNLVGNSSYFLALATGQHIDIIGVTMPFSHDEDKYKSSPPKNFDWLMLVIFIAILILIYLIVRYHDILFPTLLLPS